MTSDIRYSARSFLRTPGLALLLLLTIALGVGASAAVQGFVRGLVTRDIPLPDAEALVSIFNRDVRGTFGPVSYERYLALKSATDTFALVGAARETQNDVLLNERSSVATVAAVTPELAEILQLPLDNGAIVSDRVWRLQLGATAGTRGTAIRIAGVDTTLSGVAPPWLEGLYSGRAVDVWMRMDEPSLETDRRSRTLWALARLRPGVTADRAQQTLNASLGAAERIEILRYTGTTPEAAAGLRRVGALLRAVSIAVFLIACANIVSFLLARASARAHETAVRVALGASRNRLVRQLLADSVLVSVTGAAAGALFAIWTADIMPALFFDRDAEQLVFAADLRGIAAVSVVCAAITIVCGLAPLLETRHDAPATVLQRQSQTVSAAPRRLRRTLVVVQLTCCSVLVISTAVLYDGFRSALRTSAAQHLGRPILATLDASARFQRPDLGLEAFDLAAKSALEIPGISSTAWVAAPPGGRVAWRAVRIEPPAQFTRDVVLNVVPFTPRTLAEIRVPPLSGRMFGGGDTPQTCKVAIVNKAAAAALFDGDPIGRTIEDAFGQRVEIIGVVAEQERSDQPQPRPPTIYFYAAQSDPAGDDPGPARFRAPGRSELTRAVVGTNVVSASYFAAMNVTLVDGAVFPAAPVPRRCGGFAIVNEDAAALYFSGSPIGAALIEAGGRRLEIVGVVREPVLGTSQRGAAPTVYLPLGQDYLPRMTLILGAAEDSAGTVATVNRRLKGVAGLDRVVVTTLDAHLRATALSSERIAAVLLGAFTTTALLLGALGAYGAMAESTRQRRSEIALRMALGAGRRHIIGLVAAEGLRLAAIGALAGAIAARAVMPGLAGVTASSAAPAGWVWAAAPVVLVGIVLFASVLPARRALRVDPLTVMRES